MKCSKSLIENYSYSSSFIIRSSFARFTDYLYRITFLNMSHLAFFSIMIGQHGIPSALPCTW